MFTSQSAMSRILIVAMFASVMALTVGGEARQAKRPLWGPPQLPTPHPLPKATVRKEFVTKLRVGGVEVALEEAVLAVVAKRLGATIGERGDAGEYVAWICLDGSDSGGRWALWLDSGEIDGGRVGRFQLSRIGPDALFDRRCREMPASTAIITLPTDIRLDLSADEVVSKLGRPTARFGEVFAYLYEHSRTDTATSNFPPETWTTDNDLYLVIHHDRVESIVVSRMTTT